MVDFFCAKVKCGLLRTNNNENPTNIMRNSHNSINSINLKKYKNARQTHSIHQFNYRIQFEN